MGLRVTLNGTILTDTPRKWDVAKVTTERDKSVRGLLITYVSDLEFWGQGFDILDTLINQNYCNTTPIIIETDDCQEGTFEEEFNGTVILTQLSRYDVDKRIITTGIVDNGFSAKIRNNKSIKAFVNVGVSKNGENIQAVSPVDIGVFAPTDPFGFHFGTKREMWRVFDCFRFIIDYMTDGGIEFKSDLFSGKYFHWMLANGKELRLGAGAGNQLEVSFKDIFRELHKKTNISFAIEPTPTGYANQFQLRLEETSFFEQDAELLTLNDVRGILMSFNKEELFSHVEIGSKEFEDDVVLSYPPLNFKAFKEENWSFAGDCNIDKPLNLVSKWIIDTNIIEDTVVNGNDKYDKKTFIIITDGNECIKYKEYDEPVSTGLDNAGTVNRLTDTTVDFNALGVVTGDMAVNMLTGLTANVNSIDAGGTFCILDTDIFNNGDEYQIRDRPYNYNDPLTNIRVIERFTGGLPNSVIKQFAVSETSNFRAGLTVADIASSFPSTRNPMAYNDDTTAPFFDDGPNYDVATFEYTIPSSGLYGFEANTVMRMNGNLGAEELSNGDFSLGATDWIISGLSGSIISGGQFSVNAGIQANQLFLRQLTPILTGSIYIVNFDATISSGSISVTDGQTVTTSGTHTMVVDYSSTQFPPTSLEFRFTSSGGSAIMTIDNVSFKQTTRFDIDQSIVRSNSNSFQLQQFDDEFTFPFQHLQFQREELLTTQKTFSAFAGEKITVKLVTTKVGGSGNQTTILPTLFNQNRQETDRTDFRTILVDDGGGDIFPVDPDTFPIYKYKFSKAVTFSEFKTLVDNPEAAILFSKNQANHLFGWRNRIEYDRETSEAAWELRSKTKINGDC